MEDFVRFLLKAYFIIFFRAKFYGYENIPKKGKAILCYNHLKAYDLPLMSCNTKRLIRYMAKAELFKIPVFKSFIKWAGAFPVKRDKADVGAYKTSMKLLDEEHIVALSPYGTRALGKDISTIKLKSGVVKLAYDTDTQIIPVAIDTKYKLFRKTRVVVGKPFRLTDLINDENEIIQKDFSELTKQTMNKVYELI